MPVSYIKHGDFTFDDEKVEEIAKNCEVVNKKKAVLGQFFSPNAEINGDQLIKRRQVLLDPAAVASLDEGDTPREDQIKIVTFSERLRSFGSFIGFTRHAKKRNRDSILEQCRVQLAHNRLYDIETTRFIAMNSSTFSVALVGSAGSSNLDMWTTLTNARIELQKNGAKAPYVFLCPPEIEAAIMKEAKAANSPIQGTAEGEALFKNGYVGKYAGFEIVSCGENYMYDGSNYKAYFIGKTEGGMWPCKENNLGEGNIEVIIHDIGDGGYQDPTDENGTIALRIDYVGAFCEHPECLLKLSGATTTTISGIVSKDVPAAYELAAHSDSGRGAGRDNADYQKVVVGHGGTFKFAVNAVDGSGDALSSLSVTIKVGSSTGDTVSAGGDGKYTLSTGVKYYFSVGKTGYRTSATASNSTAHTGTFIADPQEPSRTWTLVANAG